MWTSTVHWGYVGPNLWALAIVSLVLIPLASAGASIHSFTVTGDNCGSYMSFETRAMDIHWDGAALEDDCTLYIAMYTHTPRNVNNSLCATAEQWDVTDENFILTFGSGAASTRKKYFRANEIKDNVSYCAKEHYGLNIRFFTYSTSKSHVHLKITQTFFAVDDYDSRGEPLPTAVYRLLGGIGALVMVGLLASLILKRRRRARQEYLGRGGMVIRRAGTEADEAMVALYRPAQNNQCTFTSTSTYNNGSNGYSGPAAQPFPGYLPSQPMKPPEYSENPDNQSSFPQYPDSAPPCYEDVARGGSENTKV